MREETGTQQGRSTLTQPVGSRARRSALTTLSSLALTLVNGVLALLVMRQVIVHYGSDFNGLNNTANQFITVLMLLEGGVTLATNVALFKPVAAGDVVGINRIMAATRRTFTRLGLVTLVVGVLGSLAYGLVVRSPLPYPVIAAALVMTAVSTAFTLGVAAPYTVLIQTQQREYVLNTARILTVVASQLAILVGMWLGADMLWVRALTMLGTIANGALVVWWARRTDPWLDLSGPADGTAVHGTRDVLAQKLTGAVYLAAPVMVMSATVGTALASVYAVYDTAATFLKGLLYSVANGPRMGVGQVAAEDDQARTRRVFLTYEALVTQLTLVLGATAFPLFVPYARLYTHGVDDAAYADVALAALVTAVLVLELAHIPAGHLINLTGRFRLARNIQWVGLAVLVAGLGIGVVVGGLRGIVAAVALAALVIGALEVWTAHARIVPGTLVDYARLALVPAVVLTGAAWLEHRWLPADLGWAGFLVAGVVLVALNGALSLLVCAAAHRGVYLDAWGRVLRLLRRR